MLLILGGQRKRGSYATDQTENPWRTAAETISGDNGGNPGHPGRYPAVPHRLRGVGPSGGHGTVLPSEADAVLSGPAGGQDHPAGQPEKVAGEAAEGWVHAGFGKRFCLSSKRLLGLYRAPGVPAGQAVEGGEGAAAGVVPGGVSASLADG